MGRFARSVELFKASWGVLRSDKELTVIPVVSFVCSAAVVALAGGAAWFTVDVTSTTAGQDTLNPTPLTYVVGFLGYVLVTFVVTYFTGAIVAGALERFRGGNPTLGSALGGASSRLVPLLWWSLLVGTLGFILQALEERAGFLGQLVLRGIGMAWRVVTWLAVPVIIDQGLGPFDSLKTSAGLFKQTWGENLISQGGLGLVSMLVMLPGIVVFAALSVAVPLLGIPLLVVWIVSVAIVFSTLNGILRTAVYLYATGQQAPGFEPEALAATFGPRKR